MELELIAGTRGSFCDVDCLQKIGIPVYYDGYREVAVPHSKGVLPQLYFIKLLKNIVEGSKEYSFNVHVNVGGLEYDENILILDLMMQVANFTNVDYRNINRIPGYVSKGRVSKTLYESPHPDLRDNPKGHAFKIRDSGVIEFRAISPPKDYESLSEYLFVFSTMCECLKAYQLYKKGEELTNEDRELVSIWEDVRSNLFHILTVTLSEIPGRDIYSYIIDLKLNPEQYYKLLQQLITKAVRQHRSSLNLKRDKGPSLYSTKDTTRRLSNRVQKILTK